MTFHDALRELKDGKNITRVAWHGGIFLFLLKSRELDHPTIADAKLITQPAIMVKGHNGIASSFCPTDQDLLADDWAIVNV